MSIDFSNDFDIPQNMLCVRGLSTAHEENYFAREDDKSSRAITLLSGN